MPLFIIKIMIGIETYIMCSLIYIESTKFYRTETGVTSFLNHTILRVLQINPLQCNPELLFGNFVGKGGNANNQPFPTMCSTLEKINSVILVYIQITISNAFYLNKSIFL